MIKKKDLEKRLDKEAKTVVRDLQNSYLDGLMSERSFEKWYDRVVGALAEKDGEYTSFPIHRPRMLSAKLTIIPTGMELRKVRQHIDLIRSAKDRITRSNTQVNRNNSYRSHHGSHRRGHSVDEEYARYEEKPRRPKYDHGSHHNPHLSLDTDKAQREYYYAHALPSPYKGEIEYTPLDASFDDARSSHARSSHAGSERRGRGGGGGRGHHAGDRKEEFLSQSSSVVDRGRTRSRSVHQERRVRDSSADADSEAEEVYDRREYYPRKGDRGRHR